ncbi:MAG: hypothetical protein ACRD88_04555 [Terriglobia bacterium]
MIGFFWTYRHIYPVSRKVLRDIAGQYHAWVDQRCAQWGVPIEKDPEGRRDDFVDRYYRRAAPDQVVAIIKAREPARIVTAIGQDQNWHLEIKQRWVDQYNFYVNDRDWGRMFVRVCPYFPFSARVCLNQHYWLANRLRQRGIRFQQCANAFLRCSDPEALQELANSLIAPDLIACAQKWLARFTPFFTPRERKQAGVQHRLFFAQTEYCDNLIFHRRAAVDALEERLLDANRSIGQPNKITVIFGRKITKYHKGKLQTVIEDLQLPNPVIRSHYRNGFLKQYVRDRFLLRTEPATNNISTDYGINKDVQNLPQLREKLSGIIDRYLDVQQDILETFLDRGQLRQLSQPTVLPNGKRIPGLKLDHPRQLALMHSLVRFSHLAAEGTFTTTELHGPTAEALGKTTAEYKLGSLRYDLSKLRAKGLVEKIPHSRRYRLLPQGYQICLVYLKLSEKVYAPLTAGIIEPFAADDRLAAEKVTELDRRYQAVAAALDNLVEAVGLKAA